MNWRICTSSFRRSHTENSKEIIQLMFRCLAVLVHTKIVKNELINVTRAKHIFDFPTGTEPMTSRTHSGHSILWAMRTLGEQGNLTQFICDRRPAYCYDQHCRIHHQMKMVIFELGNEMWKMNYERGTKKYPSRRFIQYNNCYSQGEETLLIWTWATSQMKPLKKLRPCLYYAGGIVKWRFYFKNKIFSVHTRLKEVTRNNHWLFWICVWGNVGQGNHMIIVTSLFLKSYVFK